MKAPYAISIVGGGSRYTPGILRMLVAEKGRFPLRMHIMSNRFFTYRD